MSANSTGPLYLSPGSRATIGGMSLWPGALAEQILNLLRPQRSRTTVLTTLSKRQLLRHLCPRKWQIDAEDRQDLNEALQYLLSHGLIRRTESQRYMISGPGLLIRPMSIIEMELLSISTNPPVSIMQLAV